MDTFAPKRPCSAETRQGRPCRAWAVRGTDPPLCSTHAGRTVGAGPPVGNTNAFKHGYYQVHNSPQEIAEAGLATLEDDLLLLRVGMKRLARFLNENNELTVAECTAVMAQIAHCARAIGYLEPRITAQRKETNWHDILDQVGPHLGMDL